jgi:hypothetical protein
MINKKAVPEKKRTAVILIFRIIRRSWHHASPQVVGLQRACPSAALDKAIKIMFLF